MLEKGCKLYFFHTLEFETPLEFDGVLSFMEPHLYAWIGGVNNGTHWFWNQGGRQPEEDMFNNGVVPVPGAARNLVFMKSQHSPASQHGSLNGFTETLNLNGFCEVF